MPKSINENLNRSDALSTDAVKELVNRTKSYTSLTTEERKNPQNHQILVNKKIIVDSYNGYDVINDVFFVDQYYVLSDDYDDRLDISLKLNNSYNGDLENIKCPFKNCHYVRGSRLYFGSFEEYYNYMNGNIYSDVSTFYQYSFTNEQIGKYKIKEKNINFDAPINYTIDDYEDVLEKTIDFNQQIVEAKKDEEELKAGIKKCVNSLLKSDTFETFNKKLEDWSRKLELRTYPRNDLIRDSDFKKYFFEKVNDKTNTKIFKYALYCSVFSMNHKDWLYVIIEEFGSKIIWDFYEKLKQSFSINILSKEELKYLKAHFSPFKNDDEFMSLVKGEISKAESQVKSGAFEIEDDEDIDDCEGYGNPQLYKENVQGIKGLNLYLYKYYFLHRVGSTEKYYVDLIYKQGDFAIARMRISFTLFASYIYFLKNNLDGANFVKCQGLKNIKDWSDISFENGYFDSKIFDSQSDTDDFYRSRVNVEEISYTKERENKCQYEQEQIYEVGNFYSKSKIVIHYISDLHLEQRLEEMGAKTKADIYLCFTKIIDNLFQCRENSDYHNIVIINGDTCHNIDLFKDFINLIPQDDTYKKKLQVFFTLGNHEYWDKNATEEKYKVAIESNGFYLLLNSVVYYDIDLIPHTINEDSLVSMSDDELRKQFYNAETIIFGGTGFSGFNETFNANNGIYKETVSREREMDESKRFNNLYDKVCRCAIGKSVVVATHMPKYDWSGNNTFHKNFIYLNGHTHQNKFYICKDFSVYANNQIGYSEQPDELPILKYFFYQPGGDIFENYKDGIYEIQKDQYIDFMKNKNIVMECNKDYGPIKMLKEKGYYCFIGKDEKGEQFIFDGGKRVKIYPYGIEFYSANMPRIVDAVKPEDEEDEISEVLKEISKVIMKIGGSGEIDDGIVTIDSNSYVRLIVKSNNISIYPIFRRKYDRGYIAYKSIDLLLKNEKPNLYENFVKIGGINEHPIFAKEADGFDGDTKEMDYQTHDESKGLWGYERNMTKIEKKIINFWIYRSWDEYPHINLNGKSSLIFSEEKGHFNTIRKHSEREEPIMRMHIK